MTADGSFEALLAHHEGDHHRLIHEIWNSFDAALWRSEPLFYLRLGAVAEGLGQTLFAFHLFQDGLQRFPREVHLVRGYARTALQIGLVLKARDVLISLMKTGHQEEETLELLARVYREMWLRSDPSNQRHPFLERSCNLYLKAFFTHRRLGSGVNAASLSLLNGSEETSKRIAAYLLRARTEGDLRCDGAEEAALLGEAAVLLDRREDALRLYEQARGAAGRSYREIAWMRRHLMRLRAVRPFAAELLTQLRIPPVIAFVGCRLDDPHQKRPYFPARYSDEVGRRVGAVLDELGVGIGFSSAAAGSDLLFLEQMQLLGGETHVVLPFGREEFLSTRVDVAGPEWRQRAEAALKRCSSVEEVTSGGEDGGALLDRHALRMVMGRAILGSRLLETDAQLVAVSDGRRSKASGGAAEAIREWEALGLPVTMIDLRSIGPELGRGHPVPRRADRRHGGTRVRRQIASIGLVEIEGLAHVGEERIPAYVEEFLGAVAERMRRAGGSPIYKNLRGDELILVFETAGAAAECTLGLAETILRTDWARRGLPGGLSVRIALHAGPVFDATDPVTKRRGFFGEHLTHATRIEPALAVGNVYVTEEFAALLAVEGSSRFKVEPVGVIALPKDYRELRLYHLTRGHGLD